MQRDQRARLLSRLPGHGPSTLVLALALLALLAATGGFLGLSGLVAYDALVAVTAAISAVNCTAFTAEPVPLVFSFPIPPPPADAAHEGMHGIPLQRLAAIVLAGPDLQWLRHGRPGHPLTQWRAQVQEFCPHDGFLWTRGWRGTTPDRVKLLPTERPVLLVPFSGAGAARKSNVGAEGAVLASATAGLVETHPGRPNQSWSCFFFLAGGAPAGFLLARPASLDPERPVRGTLRPRAGLKGPLRGAHIPQ